MQRMIHRRGAEHSEGAQSLSLFSLRNLCVLRASAVKFFPKMQNY